MTPDTTLPAITIWQPWASLLAERIKRIESRRHDRFKGLVGEWVALHAGKTYDKDADFGLTREARRWILDHRFDLPRGRVVAVAKAVEHRVLTDGDQADMALLDSPAGLYGLIFDPILKLPYAPEARGAQGIWRWTPPSDVLDSIREAEGG